MSFQSKNQRIKRERASSARQSSDRTRPLSGKSNKPLTKIDFIENLYGGLIQNRRTNTKLHINQIGLTFLEEKDITKSLYAKDYKAKQQLIEENIIMKKQINKLQAELSIQNGKTEMMRKKTNDYTKRINAEFQKQMYWGGSQANMVRGVKNQYQNMKIKYEEKCKELNRLEKQIRVCEIHQYKTYIEALENENKKLIQQFNKIETENLLNDDQSNIEQTKTKDQLILKIQRLSEQIQSLKLKNSSLLNEIQYRDHKIKHIDKLLIEKNNNEQTAKKKLKKLEKEKIQLTQELKKEKNQRQNLTSSYERQLRKVKQISKKQSETELEIFRKQFNEKQDKIYKLQKQIAYLTTLLSYWKPLDQINQIVAKKISDSNYDVDKEIMLQYSMNSTFKLNPSKQIHHEKEEYSETKSIIDRSRKGSVEQNKSVGDVMSKSIEILANDKKILPKQRIQLTADKRNTEEGVKSRKIDVNEVIDICQTLKYRFIGFGVTIEQVRKYFNYQEKNIVPFILENQSIQPTDEQSWSKMYINMRQVKQILKNELFGLNQQDATLLSRFLIEDSSNDYVYCDPNNENLRTVVKSIIKNIVGDYSLAKDIDKIKKSSKQLIEKYQTNLESALKATASKGVITKKKLLELFKGLGIELTNEVQDYLVGKLVIKSDNLNNLKYSLLFDR